MAGITDIISNPKYQDAMNQAGEVNQTKQTDTEGQTDLDKNAFLSLLVTSLQYQDPTSPMETGEMMQQMAMLGLMEQTANMTAAVEDLKKTMEMSTWQQASNMLGKQVDAVNSNGDAVTGVVNEVFMYDEVMYLLTEEDTFQIGQIVSLRDPNYSSKTEEIDLTEEEYTVGSLNE